MPTKNTMKKAYIQTFGCQMNEHDSRRMKEILSREGYEITEDMKQARLILVNTCSVRENPENKVYSLLGRLSRMKRKRPDLVIGVGGCVAQQEGEKILKREKTVDMVFGTDNVFRLPEMLKEVDEGKRVVYTDWMPRLEKIQNFIPDEELESGRIDGCKALIAITKGCNNFCTFCIVPTTRGRLVSREKGNILCEAEDLIEKGALEIQLLGQNVNSYRAKETGFYQLLEAVAGLAGLKRLRFISPHPNDWNRKLTDLMAAHPVVCNQIHLPFQVGSDRILSVMKREHTAREYLEKIDYLKTKIPGIAISTDIIVGFPGETEDEFKETLKIVEQVEFNLTYAFMYSARPGTKAAAMTDDIPRPVKEERLQRLLKAQNPIQSRLLDGFVGTTQEVLIDSAHPRERRTMNGRSDGNIPVSVPDSDLDIGDLVSVKIIGRKKHSLIGQV
ncbi:MAG: tRNA (N6-isopentenyl adenosine(37)-C2)-methylthiotransferase MiaB [Proteobacteria bacterium]|nr:tRNA (N6-isopentenyl adenosine(37)-C2)-methylthiotransferase MiaB [Pseudomonadota bacterium]